MIVFSKALIACLGFMLFTNYCAALNTVKGQLYILDAKNMAKLKVAFKNKNSPYLGALKKLLKQADRYLLTKNPSVMTKTWLPPSGDKHDYLSHAAYYWPDPSKKNGLPYKAIDGKGNPDVSSSKMDSKAFGAMITMLPITALAYYYSDDEKYAEKAASILRTWFLDPKTKMNPNLNFAEGIPGKSSGTIFGIITLSMRMQHIIDAITIIQKSPHWTEKDDLAMRKWLKDYQIWLQTSKLGRKALTQKNNHGTWFAVQMTLLQLYLSENEKAIQTIKDAFKNLLPLQFDKTGLQTFESRRALSFNYSIMNLRSWICLYKLSRIAGLKKIENIENIINGALYLAKFATPWQVWPSTQTKQLKRFLLLEPMQRCYNYFGKKEFLLAVKALPRKQVLTDIVQLRYPLDSTVKLSNNTPERKFPLEGNFKLSQEYIPIDWSQRLPGKAYATPAGIRLVSTSSSVSLVSKQSFAVTDKSYLNIELKVKGHGRLKVGYLGYRKTKWSRAEYKNIILSGDKQLIKIKLQIIGRRGVPIDRIKFVLQADLNSDFTVESYKAKHIERELPLKGDFKVDSIFSTQEYIPVAWTQGKQHKNLPMGKVYATPEGVRLVSTKASVRLVTKRSFAVTDKSYLEIELRVKGYGKLQVGYFGYRKMKWSRAEYKNVKLSGDKQLVKIKLKIISRRGVPIDRIKFVLQADPNSDFVVESYNAKSKN